MRAGSTRAACCSLPPRHRTKLPARAAEGDHKETIAVSQATNTSGRSSSLRRNLLLVASYLVLMTLIAGAYI